MYIFAVPYFHLWQLILFVSPRIITPSLLPTIDYLQLMGCTYIVSPLSLCMLLDVLLIYVAAHIIIMPPDSVGLSLEVHFSIAVGTLPIIASWKHSPVQHCLRHHQSRLAYKHVRELAFYSMENNYTNIQVDTTTCMTTEYDGNTLHMID